MYPFDILALVKDCGIPVLIKTELKSQPTVVRRLERFTDLKV